MPEEIAVSNSFPEDKILYVGTQQGTLQLYPMLVWGLECDRAAQSIYLVDKVATEKLAYKSLAAFNQPTEPPIPDDLIQVLDGETIPIETITLHDGRSFVEAWKDKREELTDNLLEAMKKAVNFITQHNPIEGLSTDNLQTSTGSADYIAVREALINLIIHQDYTDQRTVAQIELEPHRTIMVNAGASLVSENDLMNGGTSTARNPLIARALKLIGFAELAGSGLREVSRVWRNAKRRPPTVQTEEQHNRFRIELDSRPLKIIADTFWKQRLGVTVSPEAAKILGLLSNAPAGMSLAQICSGTGADNDSAIVVCQELQKQWLIDYEVEVYRLKPHLQEFAREAT